MEDVFEQKLKEAQLNKYDEVLKHAIEIFFLAPPKNHRPSCNTRDMYQYYMHHNV